MKYGEIIVHSFIRASVLGSTFLASVLIARILGPESLGVYNLVLLAINFTTLCFVSPLGLYIHREVFSYVKRKLFEPFAVFFLLYLIQLAVIGTIFLNGFHDKYIEELFNNSLLIYFIFIFYLLFGCTFLTLSSLMNVLGHSITFALSSIGYAIISILIPLVFISSVGKTLDYWFIGFGVSQFVAFICIILTLKYLGLFTGLSVYNLKLFISRFDFKSLLLFCLPLFLASILSFGLYNGFRFTMVDQVGLLEYGKFVAAYTLVAGSFSVVEQIITTIYQPKIYSKLDNEHNLDGISVWNESLETLCISLVSIVGLLVLVGNQLSSFFFGNAVGDLDTYIFLAILLEFLRVVATSIIFYFQLSRYTFGQIYYYAVAIVVSLLIFNYGFSSNIIEAFVFSISFGIFIAIILIIVYIAKKNGFINLNYCRVIFSIFSAFLIIYCLNYIGFDDNPPASWIKGLVGAGLFLTFFKILDSFVKGLLYKVKDFLNKSF